MFLGNVAVSNFLMIVLLVETFEKSANSRSFLRNRTALLNRRKIWSFAKKLCLIEGAMYMHYPSSNRSLRGKQIEVFWGEGGTVSSVPTPMDKFSHLE